MTALPKRPAAPAPIALPGVKKIIAISSGKGGVGKSTCAVNLALACRQRGLAVGLLDADIYGPSLATLLGARTRPQMRADKKLIPLDAHGLKVMSLAFIMGEDKALIWRGPMVMSAVRQMLFEVVWGDLDLLFVDLPPGTGDAQLTLAQSVVLAGAVVISTPQDLALADARRGLKMFQKLGVHILGIIENMSEFICSGCGSHVEIFGHGGAKDEAERLGVPFLGAIPLESELREASDRGVPLLLSQAESETARNFRAIADRIVQQIEGLAQTPRQ